MSLEKQSGEGRIRGFIKIPKFEEDKELCPVFTLLIYSTKVRSANFELFILLLGNLLIVQYFQDILYITLLSETILICKL